MCCSSRRVKDGPTWRSHHHTAVPAGMLVWCPAGDSTLPQVAVQSFQGPASTKQQAQNSFSATEILLGDSDKGGFSCVCLTQTWLTCLVQETTSCRADWISRMQPGFGWCCVPGKQPLLSCRLAHSMLPERRVARALKSTLMPVLKLHPKDGSSAMTLRPMPGTRANW